MLNAVKHLFPKYMRCFDSAHSALLNMTEAIVIPGLSRNLSKQHRINEIKA